MGVDDVGGRMWEVGLVGMGVGGRMWEFKLVGGGAGGVVVIWYLL